MNDLQWERLWSRVDASGDCWEWTGSQGRGYARFAFKVDGFTRAVTVHRAVWEQLVGPIPDGMQLDHLCRVRHCVKPDHIEVVTPRENLVRSYATLAGRNSRATHCPQGHPYDDANTSYYKSARRCLACHREREFEPNKRRREERRTND